MTIKRFKSSGRIEIFKALVKSDISAMKSKAETSMKWGTIFLLRAKVDPQRPMSLYLFSNNVNVNFIVRFGVRSRHRRRGRQI